MLVSSGPGLLVDVPRDKNITGTPLQAFFIAFLACFFCMFLTNLALHGISNVCRYVCSLTLTHLVDPVDIFCNFFYKLRFIYQVIHNPKTRNG